MSCIKPTAPFWETASSRPPDSTSAIASSRSGSRSYISPTALNRACSSNLPLSPRNCAGRPATGAKINAANTIRAAACARSLTPLELSGEKTDNRESGGGVGHDRGHVLRVLQPRDVDKFLRHVDRVAGLQIRIHQAAGDEWQRRKNLRSAHLAIALIGNHRAVGLDDEDMIGVSGLSHSACLLQIVLDS